MSLNLASRPFVNSRPVRRLTLVLWGVGLILTAANLTFYWRYFSGQQQRRDRLQVVEEQIETERASLDELERALANTDLEWQNRQVEFLNHRIAERMFPWSRLFDRLSGLLPADVRLTRLRPTVGEAVDGQRRVRLELRGEARDGEALLELVDRLFGRPAFRDPNLLSEAWNERRRVLEFSLQVTYLPDATAPPTSAPREAAAEASE